MSKRLGLWDPEGIANFYLVQGRYAEARSILRHSVPQMKPPPWGGFCGTPYFEYAVEQTNYKKCVDRTSDMTEEQLDQIEKQIRARYTAEPDR